MTRQQMKRLWVSLGMGTALLTASMQEAHAQYMMGMTGLLNTPSAEMNETGRLMVGGNFLPKSMNPLGQNTGNYFADLTFFSFLELAYRETLEKTSYMTSKPKYNQQDRSLSVKLQPLKEGKWWPAVAVGANDPVRSLGRNYYRSIYGVLTKHFLFGQHQLGVTVGYQGWTNHWNTRRNGVFGGITYRPAFCPQVCLIAEYDTRDVNLGVTAQLWNHVSLHAFTGGFDCIAGGVRYECTLFH